MSEFILGIDLGGTKVLSAVIDASGDILGRAKKRTQKMTTGEQVCERLLESAHLALEESGIPIEKIAAVGIGSPGPLDPQTGIIEFTPNLPFRDFPLREKIEQALGRPVYINNDVNIGTFGEWKLGAGVGAVNMVGIFVGTGTGGGLILDGKLFEGSNRVAGEIGHMIVELDGPKCGCGNNGCLESIASRTAIARDIYRRIRKGQKSTLTDKLKGDPPAVRPKALARAYAGAGAAAISVLTDEPHFQGSLDHLASIRDALPQGPPLLRKDFMFDHYQLYEARVHGADAVLLIAAILNPALLAQLIGLANALDMDSLVEVHDELELERALMAGATIVGVNNRDLRTFEVDLATTERLRPLIPPEVTVVAESGILTRADIQRLQALDVHAVLIGEALITASDPAAKIRELFPDDSPGSRFSVLGSAP